MLHYIMMKKFMVLYQIFKKEVMTEVVIRRNLILSSNVSLKNKNFKKFKEVV